MAATAWPFGLKNRTCWGRSVAAPAPAGLSPSRAAMRSAPAIAWASAGSGRKALAVRAGGVWGMAAVADGQAAAVVPNMAAATGDGAAAR